jgi:hypothetical protein
MKRLTSTTVIMLAVATSTACGRPDTTDAQRLSAILDADGLAARQITYTQSASDTTVSVTAIVEDSYRYSAELRLDGPAIYQEVVVDDALAARAMTPTALTILARPSVAPSSPLRSGAWVLDKTGAPAAVHVGSQNLDPILSSLNVLSTVQREINEGGGVSVFDPTSLSYQPRDDPFPKPGKGETRYDVAAQALPTLAGVSGSNAGTLPTPANFRRLSVYVANGHVTGVREQIGIAAQQAVKVQAAFGLAADRGLTGDALATADLIAINAVLSKAGLAAISAESLTVILAPKPAGFVVMLPAQSIQGSLYALRDRGTPVVNART